MTEDRTNETNHRAGDPPKVLAYVVGAALLIAAVFARWIGESEAAWEMASTALFLAAGFILGRGTK